jgi:hypothetical protein
MPTFNPLENVEPGSIRPEVLARTLSCVRRLSLPQMLKAIEQQPRFVEALWFIQWQSMLPGGVEKFAGELLGFMAPRKATKSMREFGHRKYTKQECLTVWKELPRDARCDLEEKLTATCGYRFKDHEWFTDDENLEVINERAYALRFTDERPTRETWEEALLKLVYERNEPYLRKLCVEGGSNEMLQKLFEDLCSGQRETAETWFCEDVIAEVIAFMDQYAARVGERLARTVVADKVFDALDYASSERVMVRVAGEARFGKTESVETWAAMWPGRGRVVRTPSSNSEKDLFKAIAEALGIAHSFSAKGETLKDKVEFTIRFSGLMLIFDEGAFLLPSNFSATTPPSRLNWIRSAIVDRKVPCVLVVTPQSYNGAVNRFVKKTGYNIDQFLGREAMRVDLPNELPHEDLIAVARVHFPEADEDLLGLIAAKAMQSESYLKAVENIARRARYNAKKRGGRKITINDVDTAIEEVMPPAMPAPAAAPVQRDRSKAARRLKAPLREVSAAFQSGQTEKISSLPGRTVTPVEETEEAAAAG